MTFVSVFGQEPDGTVFAPGRVNLIGEHIDYCGGDVLPMAISSGTRITFKHDASGRGIAVFSERFNERIDLESGERNKPEDHWSDYVCGVIQSLGGVDGGWQLYIEQDIAGGGLSSSASFTVALALVFSQQSVMPSDEAATRLAKLCQGVENNFIGVNCGIMDQMSVIMGGVIKLDCRELIFERVPALPNEMALVVFDTGVPRTLAASAYNDRVAELDEIASLTNVQRDSLAVSVSNVSLSPKLASRYRHVTTEQHRVDAAVDALNQQDWATLGELMTASHYSLARDYEVSCAQLDLAVNLSTACDGVFGARMTGAGFGGCAIVLALKSSVSSWLDKVAADYEQQTGIKPSMFVAQPGRVSFTRYG